MKKLIVILIVCFSPLFSRADTTSNWGIKHENTFIFLDGENIRCEPDSVVVINLTTIGASDTLTLIFSYCIKSDDPSLHMLRIFSEKGTTALWLDYYPKNGHGYQMRIPVQILQKRLNAGEVYTMCYSAEIEYYEIEGYTLKRFPFSPFKTVLDDFPKIKFKLIK